MKMDIQSALGRIADRQNLSTEQMVAVMRQIMSAGSTDVQIGAFLLGMRVKGETIDEITGGVQVLREFASGVEVSGPHLVDIVGSGPGEIVDFDDNDVPNDVKNKRGRLEASKGLKVELAYKHNGVEKKSAGQVVSIGPKFVVLEGKNSSFAVAIEEIFRIQILDLPVRVHIDSETKKSPEKTSLGMAYLRKGVTWIPEYTKIPILTLFWRSLRMINPRKKKMISRT